MYYINFKMFKYICDIYLEFQKLTSERRFTELEFYLKNISYYCLTFIGLNHLSQKEFNKAKKYFEICEQIDPCNWETQVNLSNVYYKLKNYEKALLYVNRALSCPNGITDDTLYNLAVINCEVHNYKDGLNYYKKLIELNPDHLMGIYNYASELLKNKNFEEGWNLYEKRFDRFENLKKIKNEFSDMKFWNGEDLNNKTIMLFNEQGSGDFFHFIRFSKNLKSLGAKVIVLANENLKSILSKVNLCDEIISDQNNYEKNKNRIDYVISVCSLPYALKINDKKDFWKENYINIKDKLEIKNDKLNVGISFFGSHLHPYDWKRSIKFSYFKNLEDLNCNFYLLQKFANHKRIWEDVAVDLLDAEINQSWINLDDYLKTFYECAVVINSLDLIVTVDTSIAHLAGAMGKKTFLLLDYNNDWRWGIDEKITEWYPSIEIIRQKELNFDWNYVIDQVKEKIKDLID